MKQNTLTIELNFETWSEAQFGFLVGLISAVVKALVVQFCANHKRNRCTYKIEHNGNPEEFENMVLPLEWEFK